MTSKYSQMSPCRPLAICSPYAVLPDIDALVMNSSGLTFNEALADGDHGYCLAWTKNVGVTVIRYVNVIHDRDQNPTLLSAPVVPRLCMNSEPLRHGYIFNEDERRAMVEFMLEHLLHQHKEMEPNSNAIANPTL
ncbi:hypothetical protein ACFOY8_14710 [Thalassospira xianhensis]|uniref:Uncharacterized protein n=1 Tax=Thalassospira xianhensis MCCC 1A02616 TaxID=1177929 RepID=A0A367UHF8_9PROT|nr:hypothetical protein [Thalassospira xianhensis]RCK07599.1 hypothetical protein TH5_00525 [Thalassospira xianhensis MCCC 1A02616]